MAKVRKPKAQNNTSDESVKTRKRDTPEMIETALLKFAGARASIAVVDTVDGVSALKKIRVAQKDLRYAKDYVSTLGKTTWRKAMEGMFVQMEMQLGEMWDAVIDGIEEDGN
jgi:hypothetical protein